MRVGGGELKLADGTLIGDCNICRHWQEVMRVTGKELKLADDTFKLQHLLDCHLLEHRDDIEELTTSALKEEQIETKLAALSAEWAEQILTFADYKTRGEVILKVPFPTSFMQHESDHNQMYRC